MKVSSFLVNLKDFLNRIFTNPLFKELSHYSVSTVLFQISRVSVELVVAKLLGPTLWGIWYLLNLLLAYRNIFELGMVNALNREIPIELGRHNEVGANTIQNLTFSTLLWTSIIVSLLIIITTRFINDQVLTNSLLWLIPVFISSQFFYLLQSIFRSYLWFKKLSIQQVLFSFIFPLVAIPLSFVFKLYGFLAGYTIALILSSFFVLIMSPIRFHYIFDFGKMKRLIKIGFPIMVVGITYTFLNTADRWFVSGFLGVQELGYYSMAILVFGMMVLIPRIISQQIYPRMAMDWGRTPSKETLSNWSSKQTKYVSLIIVPLFLIVVFLFPLLIRYLLPEYIPGIPALRIIAIGALFLPFSTGWGNVLIIIDKQIYYLYVILSAVILNIVFNFIFVRLGYGIEGIALGTVLSFSLYNFMLMVIARKTLKNYFNNIPGPKIV